MFFRKRVIQQKRTGSARPEKATNRPAPSPFRVPAGWLAGWLKQLFRFLSVSLERAYSRQTHPEGELVHHSFFVRPKSGRLLTFYEKTTRRAEAVRQRQELLIQQTIFFSFPLGLNRDFGGFLVVHCRSTSFNRRYRHHRSRAASRSGAWHAYGEESFLLPAGEARTL